MSAYGGARRGAMRGPSGVASDNRHESNHRRLGASSEIGTVLVRVEAAEFRTDCDGYGLNIFATYGTELPVEF